MIMDSMDAHIEPLIKAAKSGDQPSIDELFSRVFPSIIVKAHDLFRKYGLSEEEIDQALGVAERQACDTLSRFDGTRIDQFAAWTWTIAKRRAIDLSRKRKPTVGQILNPNDLPDEKVNSTSPACVASFTPSMVPPALAGLSPSEGELLRLHLVNNLPFRAIPPGPNDPPGTRWSKIAHKFYRTLRKFKTLLQNVKAERNNRGPLP